MDNSSTSSISVYSRPLFTGRPDLQVPNFSTLPIARTSRPEKILEALRRDEFFSIWVWPFKQDFPWLQSPLPTTHVSTKIEKFKRKVARARTWTVRVLSAQADSYDRHRERVKIWGRSSQRHITAKRELPKLKQLREQYLLRLLDGIDDLDRWAVYWEYAESVPAELRIALRWAYQWVEKLDLSLDAFDKMYSRLDLVEAEERAKHPKRARRSRTGKGSGKRKDAWKEKEMAPQRRKTMPWGLRMLCGGVNVD